MTIREIISFHSVVDAKKRAVSTLDIKTLVSGPHFPLVYSTFEHIKDFLSHGKFKVRGGKSFCKVESTDAFNFESKGCFSLCLPLRDGFPVKSTT